MSILIKKLYNCYLYALSPPQVKKETDFLSKITASLNGGIDILQLRLKEGADRQRLALGRQILQLTKERKILFIINDRLDLCRILEADGLHLGQEDIPLVEARKTLGPQKIIGISTHTLDQAYQAEKEGADYIGYGPCYATNTKMDLSLLVKKEEITELRQRLKIPFFVIGGLSLKNLAPILSAGADRVAICAGIYQSADIPGTSQKIKGLLKGNYSPFHTPILPCPGKANLSNIFDSTLQDRDESPLVSQKKDNKKNFKEEGSQNYFHHPISTMEKKQSKGQSKALTIAGSDSGGGAGIQADLKTFTSLGVWGLSVITALTAQNTLGVQQVFNIPKKFIEQQLASLFNDMGTDAVKTGMLWSPNTVEAVAECLEKKNIPLVIDPVLAAKRGEALLLPKAIPILKKRLFPLATLVTPNIPETELLTGIFPITTKDMVKEAAKKITDMGAGNVLIKGGHFPGQIFDLFFDGKEYIFFKKKRFSSPHLHGVGCTLAAAITAYLALGLTLLQAIQQAQTFITTAIQHSLPLGKGIGPVNPNLGRLEPKM